MINPWLSEILLTYRVRKLVIKLPRMSSYLERYYRKMSDSELMAQIKNAGGLASESQVQLVAEVRRRGLMTTEPPSRFMGLNAVFSTRHPLLLTLRFRGMLSSYRRRLFPRGVPVWWQDIMEVLQKINPLGIAPTIIAIVFAPAHFFGRCSPNLANRTDRYSKRRFYLPPQAFLIKAVVISAFVFFAADHYFAGDAALRAATFILGRAVGLSAEAANSVVNRWFGADAGKAARWLIALIGRPKIDVSGGAMFFLVATSPLWMFAAASMSLLMLRLVASTYFVRALVRFDFGPVLIILSRNKNLDRSSFFWNLFYFGPYFIVASVVSVVLLAPLYVTLIDIPKAMIEGDVHPGRGIAEAFILLVAAVFLITVLLIDFILFRPYARLLCASTLLSNSEMLFWWAHEVGDAIARAADAPQNLQYANEALGNWFRARMLLAVQAKRLQSFDQTKVQSHFLGRVGFTATIAPEMRRWIENLRPLSSQREWLEIVARDLPGEFQLE